MKKRLTLIIILVMLALALLGGCAKNEVEYNVFFKYGFDDKIIVETVEDGDKIEEPTDTDREGYLFLYWEKDGEAFDFSSPIKANTILNAVWEKLIPINVIIGEEMQQIYIRDKEEYTLEDFDLNIDDATLTALYIMENNIPKKVNLSSEINPGDTFYADLTSKGLKIVKNEVSTTVKSYNGISKKIYIPTFYENSFVDEIGVQAFDNKEIELLILPRLLKIINTGSFAHVKINKIVVPNTVTTIKSNAFSQASINDFAFDDNSQLVNLESHAFNRVENLASIVLPSSLKKLYARTFLSCQSLKKIYIPSSVNYLENDIFLGATNLETIVRQTPSEGSIEGPTWNILYYGDDYFPSSYAKVEIVKELPENW